MQRKQAERGILRKYKPFFRSLVPINRQKFMDLAGHDGARRAMCISFFMLTATCAFNG